MITNGQPMTSHGFMDIPWDDYRLPEYLWKNLLKTRDGTSPTNYVECWLWGGAKDVNAAVVIATRLLGVSRDQLLAVVPTCGNEKCARPSHLCVTTRKK